MEFKFIGMDDPLYKLEKDLRFRVLAKPAGFTDGAEYFPFEPKSLHLVALDGERMVGCVLFHPEAEREGRLYQMGVDSEYRGRGVGRLLVERLEEELIGRGFELITLHSRDNAVGFYEKLGFECFGKPFDEVGIPHRNMRKPIGAS